MEREEEDGLTARFELQRLSTDTRHLAIVTMAVNRTTRILAESELAVWDELVSKSPQGTLFDRSVWLRLISRVTGSGFRVAVCFEGERPVGGCALYLKRSAPRKMVSPPPLAQYSGIVLDAPATVENGVQTERRNASIINSLAELAESECASIRLIHHPSLYDVRPLVWRGWRAAPKYTYIVDLGDVRKMEAALDAAFLNRVAKARGSGIEVHESKDLVLFYSLWQRMLDVPESKMPLSREAFTAIFSELHSHGSCTMRLASMKEGTPVAGRVVLMDKDTAYDWVAAQDPSYPDTGATELLAYASLNALSGMVSRYDLCGADVPGAASFKSALGGRLAVHFMTEKACSTSARVSDSVVFVGKHLLKRR